LPGVLGKMYRGFPILFWYLLLHIVIIQLSLDLC
jgi:hypothetical protein